MSMMVVWSSCKRITEPEGPLGQSLIIQIFSLFLKLSLAAWKQEKKKKKGMVSISWRRKGPRGVEFWGDWEYFRLMTHSGECRTVEV